MFLARFLQFCRTSLTLLLRLEEKSGCPYSCHVSHFFLLRDFLALGSQNATVVVAKFFRVTIDGIDLSLDVPKSLNSSPSIVIIILRQ